MSALQVDPDSGELVRVAGRLQRVTGPPEILQGMRVQWRTIAGECILDPTVGLPIHELGAKGTPVQRVEQLVAEQGLRVPGVVSIDIGEPTLDTETRTLTVPFTGEGSLADLDRRVSLEAQVAIPIG